MQNRDGKPDNGFISSNFMKAHSIQTGNEV